MKKFKQVKDTKQDAIQPQILRELEALKYREL